MMHKVTEIGPRPPSTIVAQRLRVGQVGVIAPGEQFENGHLLCMYRGYVLLENPARTWDRNCGIELARVLEVGEKLEIVLGATT